MLSLSGRATTGGALPVTVSIRSRRTLV